MTAPSIASHPKAAPNSGSKAWASPRGSRLITTAICTSATAAARFLRSAQAARFLSLPRLSPPSQRITWRFIPPVICTFPGRQPPALIASTELRRAPRHCTDHAAGSSRDRTQRLRDCGHGAAAFRPRDSSHHRRAVHAGLGRARHALDRIIESMKAEIIAVGSELLTPDRVDTNSLFLTEELNKLGIEVVRKSIVGDNRDYLSATFKEALERVELVIASGGLGPTEDDLTRETVAELLGRKLHLNNEILRYIEGRFRQLGREMPAVNARQAMVPEGAEVLENPRGSAPGLW